MAQFEFDLELTTDNMKVNIFLKKRKKKAFVFIQILFLGVFPGMHFYTFLSNCQYLFFCFYIWVVCFAVFLRLLEETEVWQFSFLNGRILQNILGNAQLLGPFVSLCSRAVCAFWRGEVRG